MFWAEVVVTIAYLINRGPSSSLGMKTLEEVRSRHPPNIDKLGVFECVAMFTLGKTSSNLEL